MTTDDTRFNDSIWIDLGPDVKAAFQERAKRGGVTAADLGRLALARAVHAPVLMLCHNPYNERVVLGSKTGGDLSIRCPSSIRDKIGTRAKALGIGLTTLARWGVCSIIDVDGSPKVEVE